VLIFTPILFLRERHLRESFEALCPLLAFCLFLSGRRGKESSVLQVTSAAPEEDFFSTAFPEECSFPPPSIQSCLPALSLFSFLLLGRCLDAVSFSTPPFSYYSLRIVVSSFLSRLRSFRSGFLTFCVPPVFLLPLRDAVGPRFSCRPPSPVTSGEDLRVVFVWFRGLGERIRPAKASGYPIV